MSNVDNTKKVFRAWKQRSKPLIFVNIRLILELQKISTIVLVKNQKRSLLMLKKLIFSSVLGAALSLSAFAACGQGMGMGACDTPRGGCKASSKTACGDKTATAQA